ncbi:MAG: hypothetical protein ACRDD1_07210 [Planctomycetia bacterium]
MNTREEGWKDFKIAVFTKRPLGPAAAPEEWATRRLPAATARETVAALVSAKEFRRTRRRRLAQLGVRAGAEVHVLGDGADGIWRWAVRALTGCEETLDVFHAAEHLAEGAAKVFGDGTAAATAAFEGARSLLIAEGWNGVCRWIGGLLEVADDAERERRRRWTDRLVEYFRKHAGRLEYAKRLAEGRAIGSGAVEGAAKTLGLRLKARGARWRKANVDPMAALVCLRETPAWDAYWSLTA